MQAVQPMQSKTKTVTDLTWLLYKCMSVSICTCAYLLELYENNSIRHSLQSIITQVFWQSCQLRQKHTVDHCKFLPSARSFCIRGILEAPANGWGHQRILLCSLYGKDACCNLDLNCMYGELLVMQIDNLETLVV